MKLNELLITILSFIRTNILDEEILGLHLEAFARNASKVIAVVFVAGQLTAEAAQVLERKLSPQTPDFTIGNFTTH